MARRRGMRYANVSPNRARVIFASCSALCSSTRTNKSSLALHGVARLVWIDK
jgi:hypothetical protein